LQAAEARDERVGESDAEVLAAGLQAPRGLVNLKGEDGERGLVLERAAFVARRLLARCARGVEGRRGDGAALDVARDVLAHLVGRAVALRRLLPQSLHDHVVEVARQLAPQGLDRRAAAPVEVAERVRLVVARAVARGVGGQEVFGARDAHRGVRRLLLTDDARHLVRRAVAQAVGTMTSEQFVEQHAQRVNVGRGRDRLAPHLLGRGVLRRHQAHCRRRRVERDLSGELRVEELGDAEV
jgi:hypothetical protein